MADDDMVMIRGSSNGAAVSVLLRGANDYMLDEMDRSLHDAFCVVKRVLESGKVVPGAPALLPLCAVACSSAEIKTAADFMRMQQSLLAVAHAPATQTYLTSDLRSWRSLSSEACIDASTFAEL